MRLRLLVSTTSVLLLLVLLGTPAAVAQIQDFNQRNRSWETVLHIGPMVALCHIPPENPGNAHTIDVPQSAVPTHLAHGDTLGACPDEGCDGPPYPAPVAATGQVDCWDGFGNLIDCAGTGQDGEYQLGVPSPTPRFTDNGDGAVTDNLTGLIWLQDANCFGPRTWTQALSDANALASASDTCIPDLTDGSIVGNWRLPNIRELQSLIDFGQEVPALPLGHPFSGVQSMGYWSSTTFASILGGAWALGLETGNAFDDVKTRDYYVWPVRGPHDEDGNRVSLVIESLDTPGVTGQIQGDGVCSGDATVACTSDAVCQNATPSIGFCIGLICTRTIAEWTGTARNVPLESGTTSPFDDIVLTHVDLDYPGTGISPISVGLGSMTIPSDSSGTFSFFPITFQSLNTFPSDTAVSINVQFTIHGNTAINDGVSVSGQAQLNIEACF